MPAVLIGIAVDLTPLRVQGRFTTLIPFVSVVSMFDGSEPAR
jgi:hypothetical protein